MKLLRAVLGRLDPWAALLLGVLLALGVIILLATPGPWHRVVGPAPPGQLAPPAPTDVAVFALGGAGGTCTAVVWLHIDQAPAALTAVVLAPETQGFVPGAGFTPLRRIVDEVGPAAAATALGQALDVPMGAWIALDRQALRLALAPYSSAGEGRAPLLQYKRAQAAWEGRGEARRVWSTQYQALGSTLARLPFQRINVVSFSNYVLGWGHVQSDLNLQGAASLARTFEELMPARVDVRGAAAIVETCRRGEAWRVDRSAMEQLRRSLAFGLTPPAAGTSVRRRPRPARVLVVLPGPGYRSDAYVDEVRRRLRRSAGAPVAVRAVKARSLGRPCGAREPPPSSRGVRWPCSWPRRPAVGGAERAQAAAAALRRLGETLRAAGQPAVLSAPLPVETTVTVGPATDASATATLAVDVLAGTRSPRPSVPRASRSPRSPVRTAGRRVRRRPRRASTPGWRSPPEPTWRRLSAPAGLGRSRRVSHPRASASRSRLGVAPRSASRHRRAARR